MDQNLFTAWTRAFSRTPSRREVLCGLAGVGLSLGGPRLSEVEAAKKRKKRKKRKGKKATPVVTPPFELPPLVFNQYGCISVGQPCRGDSSNCCSGICQGPAPAAGQPDTSRCVAHNISICTADKDLCTSGVGAACNANNRYAGCMLTTGNAGFCADFSPYVDTGGDASYFCRDCRRDTDCQAEFGPGAACVVYDGICSHYCPATGGRACMGAGDV